MSRKHSLEDEYLACAKLGLTQAETAEKLGVSKAAVCRFAKRTGANFVAGTPGRKKGQLNSAPDAATLRGRVRKLTAVPIRKYDLSVSPEAIARWEAENA